MRDYNSKETKFIEYSELVPDEVKFTVPLLKHLIFSPVHHFILRDIDEQSLREVVAFIRKATSLSRQELPDQCWEFGYATLGYKSSPVQGKTFFSLDEVKKGLESLEISTKSLYRKYNPRIVEKEIDKGEWKRIPDDLYTKVGMDKMVQQRIEKKNTKATLFKLVSCAVLFIGGMEFIDYLFPQTNWAYLGYLTGYLIILVSYSAAAFQVGSVHGVITFIIIALLGYRIFLFG